MNHTLSTFVLIFSIGFATAQTPSAKPATAAGGDGAPITTLSAQARLVNLPVVVRDKKGALVNTLTKDDFVLKVDAKPQTIRYFDQDANLPLTLGLLVDVSGSMRNAFDEERTASTAFLDKMLVPERDKAFVIQFGAQTELLQDLTNSRPKLQAALRELGTSSPNSSNSDDNNDPNTRTSRQGTVLYDAAFLAADEVMKPVKGRKALIVLTDGEDRNSRETLNRAIEAAQRADTIIYAIYFKGEAPRQDNYNNGRRGRGGGGYPGGGYPGGGYPGGGYPGGRYPGGGYPGGGYPGGGYPGGGGGGGGGGRLPNRVDGKKILTQMAGGTGGRMFEAKKDKLADIYAQIGDELRAQYRLGYTPDAEMAADGFHEIDLTLKDAKKGYTVQTRSGYYTGK